MSFPGKWMKKGVQNIGEFLSVEKRDGDVIINASSGALRISSPIEHVIRLRSGRGGEFGEDRSFAVECDDMGAVGGEVSETPEKIEAAFAGLRLVASKKPIFMSVYDTDDVLVFRDHPRIGMNFLDQGVMLAHQIEPAARYYGFGEKTGPLEKYGTDMTMWNTDMIYHKNYEPLYISIPFAVVLREGRAHGLFFDNPSRSRFSLGTAMPGTFIYEADAGELDLYVIEGPRISDVVERFSRLTGTMPLPPRWALGHHQCRLSYMNEAEVRGIAKNFRERDIPTDVIYMDIHYMDRYRVFTFNEKRFPDTKALAADLGKKGFKLVASIDPGVAVADDFFVYQEGSSKGYFCNDEAGNEFHSRVWPGKSAFPDFSREEVRQWWGNLHKPLVDAGIEGVWDDMNEPSAWSVDLRFMDMVIPLKPVRHPRMVHDDEGRNTPHLSFRNVYGLMECKATREGLDRLKPGGRPFILSRSGYAGIQKYAAVWTGDNSSRFSHLALSLPMLMNLGLSGVGFAGPDIGGFMWNCSPELYARWIQLGAFYPFCRTHSAISTRRQEPWSFGPEVERIARDYIKLRYRLHPTLYSLVRECHETGAPILRPLFYDFQEDHAAAEIEDQCMFGPGLMLAPVVKKGQRRRNVYLPAGVWTDFWTGEKIRGPKMIKREAPLSVMPIYIREGAALFKWPVMSWLGERPVDRLIMDLYPPEKGESSSMLYEDDGETDEYLKGAFAKRHVTQERTKDKTIVRFMEKEGDYEPPARSLVIKIHVDKKPEGVQLDGKGIEIGDGGPDSPRGQITCDYQMSERVVRIVMPDDHGAHEIVLGRGDD